MDTQMKKQNLTEPIMLANQAVAEMKKKRICNDNVSEVQYDPESDFGR